MADTVRGVFAKLDRAIEHILQLDRDINGFLAKDANGRLVYDDPQTLKTLEQAQVSRVVPLRISLTVGEILYQLRSSLDHLACGLILQNGGTLTDQSQFPIERFKPVKKKDLSRYQRKIQGMAPEAATQIQGYQPYLAGDRRDGHWAAVLKSLNNLDKHRALVLHAVRVQRASHVTLKDARPGIPPESIYCIDIRSDTGTDTPPQKPMYVEIVNVERYLAPYVAFQEVAGRSDVAVLSTLVGLHQSTKRVASELARFF